MTDRKQSERLLQGLQQFVNLGDSVEEYRRFAQAWPDFFPVLLRSGNDPKRTLGWSEEFRVLVFATRDILRDVWRTGSKSGLAFVLGFGHDAQKLINDRVPDHLDLFLSTSQLALFRAIKHIPVEYFADLAEAYPDWKKGEFIYEPKNEFQRAVHLLWRQSWRAKSCWHCHKYFVADKPAQVYCSVECSSAEKKERGRTWWKEHGESWRAKRRQAGSRMDSKRKSPRRTKR